MTSCFPFVRRKQRNNKEVYLVILGLDNAGKTTTTRSIKGVSSDLVAPTIGFDRIEFAIDRFNVNLYDLGGGRTIRDIWQTYFAEVHGVIFVVDSSAPDRLEECHSVLNKLFSHPSICGKPVLLLANKQDIEEAMDEADLIDALELDTLANEYRCPCRLERCCALLASGKKLDKGIRTGLRWLLAYIDSEWDTLDRRISTDVARQAREQALEREARRERVRLAREKRERLERERKGMENDNEPVPENEGVPFGRGDSTVEAVDPNDGGDLAQPRSSSQVTVIDLETKIRSLTTLQSEDTQKQRIPITRRRSTDFTSTPEPILVRESIFTAKPIARLSVPSKKTTKLLLNSQELRRQIQIACSIDLDPTEGRKSSLAQTGEVIQIVELDESEDAAQRPASMAESASSSTCQLSESRQGLDKVTQEPTADICALDAFLYDDSLANQLGVIETQTNETSLESVPEVCNKPKTGLVPPMIDSLYGRTKKSSLCLSDSNSGQQGDRPFSFLIVSSRDKRPSPITRLFLPNINKLHPQRRFSETDKTIGKSVSNNSTTMNSERSDREE
ncbi:hypothetical protein FBUS_02387 [Fasciolopsis buskii]|uniref:ADP-ribosylation factor-like protein 13B n=1 Tax=Fasciolopsis buskii TaxID=27845 RepID=A0A8E0S2T5_9TREM|nr:hypothetical protein FBUS_02387 [Fasciolopsis buski]